MSKTAKIVLIVAVLAIIGYVVYTFVSKKKASAAATAPVTGPRPTGSTNAAANSPGTAPTP